jgi:cell division protein FtsA
MTGMSTRIGYPNEHIAKSAVEDVTSPLACNRCRPVMKGFDYLERRRPMQPMA